MRAAVLREYGDVDELDAREVPDPTVGPREVMVRMAGASRRSPAKSRMVH